MSDKVSMPVADICYGNSSGHRNTRRFSGGMGKAIYVMQTSSNGSLKTATRVGACRLLAATALLGCLAGCGLRGPLVMPKEDAFPQAAAAPQTETAPAESGQGKPEGAAPKPHKPFILDGLLR